ncbi:MAG: sugar phosphate isomerase/epimerase [bacterium]
MQVGVQLYTLRDTLDQDLDGGLKRISELGFRFVETAGFYDLSPEALRDKFDANGLVAVASHTGLDAIEADLAKVVSDSKALGLGLVVVPWISADAYEGRWEEIASRLNGVGATLADEGIRLAYHNHDFEFKADNGIVPMEFFADHLDPEAVGFEIDLAWVAHAGQNPVEWIEKLADQIDVLHMKDVTVDGQLADVGKGKVDWDAVLAAAADAGITSGLIEHDNPGDAFASISASKAFLESKGCTF